MVTQTQIDYLVREINKLRKLVCCSLENGGSNPQTSETGSYIADGDGTNIVVIPHNLGVMPSYANVVAKTSDATGFYSVNADANEITLNYQSSTPNGVGNLEYYYIVRT